MEFVWPGVSGKPAIPHFRQCSFPCFQKLCFMDAVFSICYFIDNKDSVFCLVTLLFTVNETMASVAPLRAICRTESVAASRDGVDSP